MAAGKAAAAKKKVVVAPSGTKRLLDGNCEASCSKRYREQSQSELATKVSDSNKCNDCNNLLIFICLVLGRVRESQSEP
jgi:hypothetical protein